MSDVTTTTARRAPAAKTDPAYRFEKIERATLGAVVSCHHRAFQTGYNPADFDWKYFQNPAGHVSGTLMFCKDTPVGMRAFLPVTLAVRGREITAAQEVDVTVLDEHRRLDTCLQLVFDVDNDLREKGRAFTFAFANEPTAEISRTILNKTKISTVNRLV